MEGSPEEPGPSYQYSASFLGRSLPRADFKNYFMVPCDLSTSELAEDRIQRAVQMNSPYKEHVLQRFCVVPNAMWGLPLDFE